MTSPPPEDRKLRDPVTPVHRSFTTRAQAEFRRGGRRRLIWAALVALAGLVAVVLLGPSEEEVKRRFEFYGARGEMHIMNEISIEKGKDLSEQVPHSLRVPPPPAKIEIEKEKPTPEGVEPAPQKSSVEPNRSDVDAQNPQQDAVDRQNYQVEMSLPQQTNRDFYLIRLVRPEYPLDASEAQRRTPVVVVRVGIFVDPHGDVTEAMVLSNSGGPAYERAVLKAVKQWKFGWLVEPGAGRWLQFPVNFKSPYFIPDR